MIQQAYEANIELTMEQMQQIFGQHDLYVKKIERDLHVDIIDRNGNVKITGEKAHVEKAKSILEQLMILSERGNEIEEQSVNYAITMGMEDEEEVMTEIMFEIPSDEDVVSCIIHKECVTDNVPPEIIRKSKEQRA